MLTPLAALMHLIVKTKVNALRDKFYKNGKFHVFFNN